MKARAGRSRENKNQAVANGISRKPSSGETTLQFVDKRTEAIAQRKFKDSTEYSSPQKYI